MPSGFLRGRFGKALAACSPGKTVGPPVAAPATSRPMTDTQRPRPWPGPALVSLVPIGKLRTKAVHQGMFQAARPCGNLLHTPPTKQCRTVPVPPHEQRCRRCKGNLSSPDPIDAGKCWNVVLPAGQSHSDNPVPGESSKNRKCAKIGLPAPFVERLQ